MTLRPSIRRSSAALVVVAAFATGAGCATTGDVRIQGKSDGNGSEVAVGSNGSPGRPDPGPTSAVLAALKQSADDTVKATSGRYQMTFGPTGEPFMTVTGEFNDTSMHQTTSANPGALSEGGEDFGGDIEMVTDGTKMYLRGSLFGGATSGDAWYEFGIPGGDMSIARGALGTQGGVQTVKLLDGAYGEVTTIGPETVRDVPTTHYRVAVDLSKVAEGSGLFSEGANGTYPVDVWIGDDGLVRKMQFSIGDVAGAMLGPGAAGDDMDMVTTFELWDVGAEVPIEVPASAEPLDLSDVLGGFGGK